jgi:hypothetical protein
MKRTASILGLALIVLAGFWYFRDEPAPPPAQVVSQEPPVTAAPPTPQPLLEEHRAGPVSAVVATPDAGASKPGPTIAEQFVAWHDLSTQMAVSVLLERNAEEAAADVDKYCEKAKQERGEARFKDAVPSSEDDAGPFLAPLVDWFTGPAMPPDYQPQLQGRLHLLPWVFARLHPKKFPSLFKRSQAARFDFAWMREALRYGHWTPAGPAAGEGAAKDPSVVSPDLDLLLSWAKLRYIAAQTPDDLRDATVEVQHLAWLVHTSGGLAADTIAARMMALPPTRAANQPKPLPGFAIVDPVDPPPSDELSRAGAAFFWPGVDAAVMKRALACAPSPCSAFLTGASLRKMMGELSPVDDDDAFWSLGAGMQSCDAALLERLRSSQPIGEERALTLLRSMPRLPLERFFPDEHPPQSHHLEAKGVSREAHALR